jgi:hypothetical protein
MRSALWWVMLLGLGVLLGFFVRLLLPRTKLPQVYDAPIADSMARADVR